MGDKIPSATLKQMTDDGPADITADELFGGKKVVVFAVPGAFTPTCSVKHLPGFVQQADAIKAKGVDDVACLSVNDAFVMGAWGEAQGAIGKVKMVGDGDGEFTKAIGQVFDLSGKGLGVRSQRYAMILEDGTIKALDVDAPGGFEVSSAEAVLAKL